MSGDEDNDDKQFEATQHKLREARKKGNVFKSKDITQLLVQITGFLLLFTFSTKVFQGLTTLCKLLWGNIDRFEDINISFVAFHAWKTVIGIIVPTLIILATTAVVIEMIQLGGPLFTTEPMKFKLDKINPMKGLKNMFSVKSLFELVKGLLKVISVGFIAYLVVSSHLPKILGNIDSANNLAGFYAVAGVLWEFFWKSSIFLFAVSIVDFLFQRWKYMKDQRMSFKEMKDEYKNTEGDPLIKSKRKQKQREIAMGQQSTGMGQVPDADFVVKNPDHVAIAVKYNEDMDEAPRILAKGSELLAEQIIEIAEAYNIPVITNIPLSRALFRLVRVNQEIPPELYKAVAEVLLFVYKLKKKKFK
jgi:flagellar biosynthetic protein FlhB